MYYVSQQMTETFLDIFQARESNPRQSQAAPSLRYALNHIVTTHPNPTLDAECQAGRHWVPFLEPLV